MIIKRKKTPGQKLLKGLSLKSKFWISSISGMALTSIGLFFLLQIQPEYVLKADHDAKILLEILLFGLFNAGLVLFSKGVIYKMQIKLKKAAKDRQKKFKKRIQKDEKSQEIEIQKNPQV